MKANHVYFPPTTPQQRKLLFETWEQNHNVMAACKKAHVGRATFYYWKARFAKNGYAGLESYEQVGAPVGTGRIAAEIQSKWWRCIAQTLLGANGAWQMKWPRRITGCLW